MSGQIQTIDNRRELVVPGDKKQTIAYTANLFCNLAKQAIEKSGFFTVALSGGSTPKALYQKLSSAKLDWKKVLLFWSDERTVGPNHPDSNYKMAMDTAFSSLSLAVEHIFRMEGEIDVEEAALAYDRLIRERVPGGSFDLILLGMGEDGHTASLFPYTHGLHAPDRLAIANYLPQQKTWRLTLTFECLKRAKKNLILITGKNKASTVQKIFFGPEDFDQFPVQRVGTEKNKALWIVDQSAAKEILEN